MQPIELLTFTGALVAEVLIPPFDTLPGVVAWGQRVFVLDKGRQDPERSPLYHEPEFFYALERLLPPLNELAPMAFSPRTAAGEVIDELNREQQNAEDDADSIDGAGQEGTFRASLILELVLFAGFCWLCARVVLWLGTAYGTTAVAALGGLVAGFFASYGRKLKQNQKADHAKKLDELERHFSKGPRS